MISVPSNIHPSSLWHDTPLHSLQNGLRTLSPPTKRRKLKYVFLKLLYLLMKCTRLRFVRIQTRISYRLTNLQQVRNITACALSTTRSDDHWDTDEGTNLHCFDAPLCCTVVKLIWQLFTPTAIRESKSHIDGIVILWTSAKDYPSIGHALPKSIYMKIEILRWLH